MGRRIAIVDDSLPERAKSLAERLAKERPPEQPPEGLAWQAEIVPAAALDARSIGSFWMVWVHDGESGEFSVARSALHGSLHSPEPAEPAILVAYGAGYPPDDTEPDDDASRTSYSRVVWTHRTTIRPSHFTDGNGIAWRFSGFLRQAARDFPALDPNVVYLLHDPNSPSYEPTLHDILHSMKGLVHMIEAQLTPGRPLNPRTADHAARQLTKATSDLKRIAAAGRVSVHEILRCLNRVGAALGPVRSSKEIGHFRRLQQALADTKTAASRASESSGGPARQTESQI